MNVQINTPAGMVSSNRLLGGMCVNGATIWTADFTPQHLFFGTPKPNGVWYDPSDLTTMYQDHDGRVPATYGQPVGLMLDKSKKLTGPNTFVGFPVSTGSWVANGDGSWTIGDTHTEPQDLNGDHSITSPNGTYQEWVFTISGLTPGRSIMVYPNSNSATWYGNGTHRIVVPKNSWFIRFRAPPGYTATVSNISVREVFGLHATQPTVTARPTLGRMPKSGRRNILMNSGDPSLWGGLATAAFHSTSQGIALYEVTDSDLTGNPNRNAPVTLKANTNYTLSAYVKMGSALSTSVSLQGAGTPTTGITVNWNPDGTISSLSGQGVGGNYEHIGDGVYRVWKTALTTTGEYNIVYIWPGTWIGGGITTGSLLVGNLQLEEGEEVTPYQRVGTSGFDVIEDGVKTIHYLQSDGIDDMLSWSSPLTTFDEFHIGHEGSSSMTTGIDASGVKNILKTRMTTGYMSVDKALSIPVRDKISDYYSTRFGFANYRRAFSEFYGTELGQVPLHLSPGDAVSNVSGNVLSVPNRGGASTAFDATATSTGITQFGNLFTIPTTNVYLTTANAADLVGTRLFMVAAVDPSLTTQVNFAGHAIGLSDGQRTNIYWDYQNQRLLLQRRDNYTMRETSIISSGFLPATLNLIEVEITQGLVRFWINGGLMGTAPFDATWSNFFLQRVFAGFSSPFFAGQAGDVVSMITDGSPSMDERATQIRQLIATKHGVSLS